MVTKKCKNCGNNLKASIHPEICMNCVLNLNDATIDRSHWTYVYKYHTFTMDGKLISYYKRKRYWDY